MNSYLRESLCSGVAPSGVSCKGPFERNALISKMLLSKNRVRLICAPSFMGKTTLAYFYAQIVHSFDGVIWLDAAHPCLLRDLERGILADEIMRFLKSGALAVFENIPKLGDDLGAKLKNTFSCLVDAGVEVVATCIPPCNPYSDAEESPMVLQACDLLLTDDEIEHLRVVGYVPSGSRPPVHDAGRIAGIFDRTSTSIRKFLIAQEEDAPNLDHALLTYAMVLIGSGEMKSLSYVMGRDVCPEDLESERYRPYASSSSFERCFVAEGFPLGDVLAVMRKRVPKICSKNRSFSSDSFVCRLADVMMSQGLLDRATRTIIELCHPSLRRDWLERNCEAFIEHASPLNVELLKKSLEGFPLGDASRASLSSMFARMLLDGGSECFQEALAYARNDDAPFDCRMRAAAYASIGLSSHPSSLNLGKSFDIRCMEARKRGHAIDPLAGFWNSILEGESGVSALIRLCNPEDCSSDWLLAAVCCMHGLRVKTVRSPLDAEDAQIIPEFTGMVRDVLECCSRKRKCESIVMLAKNELESMGLLKPWSKGFLGFYERIEIRLRVQRGGLVKLATLGFTEESTLAFLSGSFQSLLSQSIPKPSNVPTLTIHMFGRFEVQIGGRPINRKDLSRLKTRSLLVLMALDAGKDLSCERLAEILWPDSLSEKAKRNFYSIFSILRHSLRIADGGCPYLIRAQGVCRLSSAYLKSDAEELATLCRKLRFNAVGEEGYFSMLMKLKEIYQGELLPGEKTIPVIESARSAWKNRVVDALLSAGWEVRAQGDLSLSLDYVQFALECDQQREDAYELLMVLQYDRNQRSSAMDTYFEYQRINRELGLDPSEHMRRLYERIINDDMDSYDPDGGTAS